MTVGCRGLGDSDPSVTAESSASRREMAPSQVTESQRKDSQQKDSDPSWDKNVRTEGAPPGWLLGVFPAHYILRRARAGTRTVAHTAPHFPPAGFGATEFPLRTTVTLAFLYYWEESVPFLFLTLGVRGWWVVGTDAVVACPNLAGVGRAPRKAYIVLRFPSSSVLSN